MAIEVRAAIVPAATAVHVATVRRDGDGGERRRPLERRQRPHFTPPPELPQRPKAKRLKPPDAPQLGARRAARGTAAGRGVRLQGGIPAVRQAVQEQNARLKAEGKDEVLAAGLLLSMAEQLSCRSCAPPGVARPRRRGEGRPRRPRPARPAQRGGCCRRPDGGP
ncbi:MAG: hypothetical protein R2713_17735 [Ilumatobacteraceae bacterium]